MARALVLPKATDSNRAFQSRLFMPSLVQPWVEGSHLLNIYPRLV